MDTGIDSNHMPINIQGEAESDKYHLFFQRLIGYPPDMCRKILFQPIIDHNDK